MPESTKTGDNHLIQNKINILKEDLGWIRTVDMTFCSHLIMEIFTYFANFLTYSRFEECGLPRMAAYYLFWKEKGKGRAAAALSCGFRVMAIFKLALFYKWKNIGVSGNICR